MQRLCCSRAVLDQVFVKISDDGTGDCPRSWTVSLLVLLKIVEDETEGSSCG